MTDPVADFAIEMVLKNEATCRMYVKELQRRGVVFSVPPEKLNHKDLVGAVRHLIQALKEQEVVRVVH